MEHAVKGGSYEVVPMYIPGVEKLLAGQAGMFAEVNPIFKLGANPPVGSAFFHSI